MAVIAAVALLALVASVAAARAPAPTIGGLVTYIFGDSMSDVGNNNFFPNSLARANFPWYGVDYPGRVATGRFSNGRTIGDVMSEKFGVPPPPAFLSLNLADGGDAILKGVNFASGGAGILNETGSYFVQYLSFDEQIGCFEKLKNAIAQKVGMAAAEELSKGALYQIGLGSNDYINNFLQPFMADGQQYTHDGFVGLLMSTLTRQLKRLHGLGARRIVFNLLGPLGCIPSQRVKSGDGGCLETVNSYVREFNFHVTGLLRAFNAELPGAQMAVADCYTPVMELINHPDKYGFKTSHTSCCGVDKEIGGLCMSNSKLCANRRDFVFWDAYHTSDAANQIIADQLFAQMNAPAADSPASPPVALGGRASGGPSPAPARSGMSVVTAPAHSPR